MKKKDFMRLAIDYTHNIYSCPKHSGKNFPNIFEDIMSMDSGGFYEKNEEKIEKALTVEIKSNIFQIISMKPLNLMQLKKILHYSYSTIHEHVHDLKRLKLIKLVKNKSEKGKMEMKITIHPNIKVVSLTESILELLKLAKKQSEYSQKNQLQFKNQLENQLEKISKIKTIKRSTRLKENLKIK